MKTSLALMAAGLLLFAGCKKSSNNPVAVGLPAAPAVAFTMHMESGTDGMIFVAAPSKDVMVAKVTVTYPPAQFVDVITNPDPATVIPKGSSFQIGEYTGVEMKQVWVLTFEGVDVATKAPFKISMNWEVI